MSKTGYKNKYLCQKNSHVNLYIYGNLLKYKPGITHR